MNTEPSKVEIETRNGQFHGTIWVKDGWLVLEVPFLGQFEIDPDSAREFCNDVLSHLVLGSNG